MTYQAHTRLHRSPRLARSRLIVSLVLTLLLLGGCDQQLELTEEEYLNRATVFEQQGDLSSAIIEYKNALRVNPSNAATRWAVGLLRLQQKKWSLAENHLRNAMKTLPHNRKIATNLANALLPQGKYEEVLELFEIDRDHPSIVDATPLVLEGTALLGLLRPDEARTNFEQALSLQPGNPEATLGLAQIFLETNEWQQARDAIASVLDAFPNHIKGLMLQGDLYRLRGEKRQAVRTYSRVLDLDPRNIAAHLSRAQVFLSEGRFDAAVLDVTTLKKYVPEYPISNYLQALVSFEKQDYETAEDSINKVLKAAPDHSPSLLLLATLQHKKGALDAAAATLNRYLDIVPDNLFARKLMAQVQLKLNHPDEAIQVLSLADQQLEDDNEAAALFASAYLQSGNPSKATEIVQRAVNQNPDDPQLRATLGMIQATAKLDDRAIETLEKASELGADSIGVDAMVTLYHLKNKAYAKALVKADELAARDAASPLGPYFKGLINAAQGKPERGRRYFELALQADPSYLPATIALAKLEAEQGDSDALNKRLKTLLSGDQNNPQILQRLAREAEKKNDYHQAIAYWQRLQDLNPDLPQPYISLSLDYLHLGETRKALVKANKGRELHPMDPRVLETLGIALILDGQPDEAAPIFVQLTTLYPSKANYYMRLAQAENAAGKLLQAEDSLRQALDIDPVYLPALKALAELELENARPEQALKLALRMTENYPNDVEATLLLSKVFSSIQEYGKAIEVLDNAYQVQPNRPTMEALFRLYQMDDRLQNTIELLQRWIALNPGDNNVRTILADKLLKQGDTEAAEAGYRKVIENTPESAAAHNNLAWLLFKKGDGTQALKHAEIAYKADKDDPAIADTIGWILIHTNQIQRGLRILERVVNAYPYLNGTRYHLAVGYHLNSEDQRARAELQRALLEKDKGFDGDQDAMQLLEKLSRQQNSSAQALN